MHKIVYLPISQADLMEALDYLSNTLGAPQAASDLLDEFDDTVKRVARFPYAHELYRTNRPLAAEIRKAPVKGYVLYYAAFEDCIEIRRFLHGRRDRSADIGD